MPLGVLLALARISKYKLLRDVVGAYIWLLRGTPLLLQVFFVYYGLPNFGITLENFPAACIAFVLNYAAYFAEIFRAGIQSIDKGQYEGAKVLGFTYWQTMWRIILPQTVRRVLPPVSNEAITLVKDTALVYAIGLGELLRATKIAVSRDAVTSPFVVAAVFYLVMTYVLTKVFDKLEQRYSIYE
nr:amino acid ABC transporter permease [Caldicoprobacter faecalis]